MNNSWRNFFVKLLESISKFFDGAKKKVEKQPDTNLIIDPEPKPPILIVKKKICAQDIILANPKLFQGKPEDWVKFIWFILHHSLTKDGQTVNWKAIWKYHTSFRIDGVIIKSESEWLRRFEAKKGVSFQRPWRSIGYHVGEETVNNEHQIFAGRPLHMTGAHAKGFNGNSLGMCIVGNYNKEKLPKDEMELSAITAKKFLIVMNIPVVKVIGHRDTYPILNKPVAKTCPGSKFSLEEFREMIKKIDDKKLIGV